MKCTVWQCILVGCHAFFQSLFVLLTVATIGFVYGAFQAYARAFYAELIPKGEEAKWYALFSITDKVRKFGCSSSQDEISRASVLLICWPLGRRLNRRSDGQHTLRVLLCGLHDMARRSATSER